jgi:Kef-type K+ transport system membrane component KefB
MAAVVLCMLMSSLAEMVQLAPIIGAFAAGVVLAKTQEKVRFEEKVKSIGDMFVPLFFVIVGARMDLSALTPSVALSALLFVALACGAKVAAGLSIPGKGIGRWIVGIGMIPRGEVSLIFASIGQTQHLISPAVYASIVFVVISTTFITPPILKIATLRFEQQSPKNHTSTQ